jgi:hypothetical protein
MKNLTATICMTLALLIIVPTPVISADLYKLQVPPSQQKKPGEIIEDGMNIVLNSLKLLLKSIPQYKAPEVLKNGDIIIRRVTPGEEQPKTRNKHKKTI